MSDIDELLAEAETLVAAAHGYEPWDREEKLGERWDSRSPEAIRWVEVHGHDPRLKCYPEFGCQLLEIPWAKAFLQVIAERDALRDGAAKIAKYAFHAAPDRHSPLMRIGWELEKLLPEDYPSEALAVNTDERTD